MWYSERVNQYNFMEAINMRCTSLVALILCVKFDNHGHFDLSSAVFEPVYF